MAEQLSLWSALAGDERGYELRCRWGSWLPCDPGSVVREQFELVSSIGLERVELRGDGQELWFRRSVAWDRPCVFVSDGCPSEGGMRVLPLPGQRLTRAEREDRGTGGWLLRWEVRPGSFLADLVAGGGRLEGWVDDDEPALSPWEVFARSIGQVAPDGLPVVLKGSPGFVTPIRTVMSS